MTSYSSRLLENKNDAMRLLRPGSWLVQGTLGLAYPGSMESHVCLAEWCGVFYDPVCGVF